MIIKNVLLGVGVSLVLYSMYSGSVVFVAIGTISWLCGLGLPDELELEE